MTINLTAHFSDSAVHCIAEASFKAEVVVELPPASLLPLERSRLIAEAKKEASEKLRQKMQESNW
ncbi:MAG TPA: hypothetical protein VH280_25745 [Verrucomicrobiae bacterium]|jgi:hypothetical protein|nr:hypothetical protein [Verrucomicrobiae bacterium]